MFYFGCDEVEVWYRVIGFNYLDMEDCRGVGYYISYLIFILGFSVVGVIIELGKCVI